MTLPKPHYRLRTNGALYEWRGRFLGWKRVARIVNGKWLFSTTYDAFRSAENAQ